MPQQRHTRAQLEQRIRAAQAKNLMHRDGLSLRAASAQARVSGSAVLRWFPGTIVKDDAGRWIALPDREVYRMRFVAVGLGPVEANVRGSTQRRLVGRQGTAIAQLLDPRSGTDMWLRTLRGQRVAGLELETDPAVIEGLYLAGELDWLVVYVEDV